MLTTVWAGHGDGPWAYKSHGDMGICMVEALYFSRPTSYLDHIGRLCIIHFLLHFLSKYVCSLWIFRFPSPSANIQPCKS
jgi:hypothetical protein